MKRSVGCSSSFPANKKQPPRQSLARDTVLSQFYACLLAVLRHPAVREGNWQLLDCRPAWDGNWTHDCFIAFGWEKSPTERLIAVVNFSDHQSQAKLHLPFATSNHEALRFQDLLGNAL
jgi:hypothetical protein